MKTGTLEAAVKVVFLVLLALLVFADPLLFLIFFVPVAGWFIWSAYDRTAKLERRLASLEKPQEQKSEEA